jgi:hypothetical protein
MPLVLRIRRQLAAAAVVALSTVGLWGVANSVSAQTTTVPPTTSLGLDIRFALVDGNISQVQQTGGQLIQVIVQNSGPALSAAPIVVRFGMLPSVIQNVTENGAQVGVIDQKTFAWYHTIPSIGEGRSITYLVNWYSGCAGRWPLAARVGERRVSTVVQYAGQSLQGCPPDESVAPAPPSFYELAWPAAPVATTTTVSPSALPTAPTSVGATTTTINSTLPGTGSTVVGASNPSTSSTVALPTTSTTKGVPTTRRVVPTTRVRSQKPTTSVEVVCKTVGGRRYCGAKSSILKKGQQKPREVKPPTTKKK